MFTTGNLPECRFIINIDRPVAAIRLSSRESWKPIIIDEEERLHFHSDYKNGKNKTQLVIYTSPERPLNYFDMVVADALWTAKDRCFLPPRSQMSLDEKSYKKAMTALCHEIVRTLTGNPDRQVTYKKNRLTEAVMDSIVKLRNTSVTYDFANEAEFPDTVPWRTDESGKIIVDSFLYSRGHDICIPLYEYTLMSKSHKFITVYEPLFISPKGRAGQNAIGQMNDSPETVVIKHFLAWVTKNDTYRFDQGHPFVNSNLQVSSMTSFNPAPKGKKHPRRIKQDMPYQNIVYFFPERSIKRALFSIIECRRDEYSWDELYDKFNTEYKKKLPRQKRIWMSYLEKTENILDEFIHIYKSPQYDDQWVLCRYERRLRSADDINKKFPFRYEGLTLYYEYRNLPQVED